MIKRYKVSNRWLIVGKDAPDDLDLRNVEIVLASDYDAKVVALTQAVADQAVRAEEAEATAAELAGVRSDLAMCEAKGSSLEMRADKADLLRVLGVADERVKALEAELTADNELFQQRWREWQAERDALKAALREARRWIGDGDMSDGMSREIWTRAYAAVVDLVDTALTTPETPTTKLTSVSSKSASALETSLSPADPSSTPIARSGGQVERIGRRSSLENKMTTNRLMYLRDIANAANANVHSLWLTEAIEHIRKLEAALRDVMPRASFVGYEQEQPHLRYLALLDHAFSAETSGVKSE